MREVDLGIILAEELEYCLLAVLVAELAAQAVRQGLVDLQQCFQIRNGPDIRVLDYLISIRILKKKKFTKYPVNG